MDMPEMERHLTHLETRMSDFDKLSHLLKDELGGLRLSMGSLLAADREKSAALEGHHKAYASASLRAEISEARAIRAEARAERLEDELRKLQQRVDALVVAGGAG